MCDKSDKTVTNVNLTTKVIVTGDSFHKHIKRFAFIVASSVRDTNTLSFVIKFKLVTVLSLFLDT